jgi:hypothetical protein
MTHFYNVYHLVINSSKRNPKVRNSAKNSKIAITIVQYPKSSIKKGCAEFVLAISPIVGLQIQPLHIILKSDANSKIVKSLVGYYKKRERAVGTGDVATETRDNVYCQVLQDSIWAVE